MNELTKEQLEYLTEWIRARKIRLLEEIRAILARSGKERYADLVGEVGDTGDEAVGSVLRDVTEAEIIRDVGEVRDIVAAEQRLSAGRYGVCTDCGAAIDYKRLEAYPTAKRCITCQQRREKTRAPSQYTKR